MSAPRHPGWYADPDGLPGLLRWWDGAEWAEMTLAAGAPPAPPAAAELTPARHPWPWYLAVVLVIAVTAAVAVAALPRSDDLATGRSRPPVAGPVEPPGPPPEPLPGFPRPPGAARPPTYTPDRIIDPAAGLSYPRPAGPWQQWDPSMLLVFGLGSAGVYRDGPAGSGGGAGPGGGRGWVAKVVSGPLLPVVPYNGPSDLPAVGTQLAATVQSLYYPPHSRAGLTSTPVRIDGHPGHLVRFDLRFSDYWAHDYGTSRELGALLVVDRGGPAPGVLYLSFPEPLHDLWPYLQDVHKSVRVVE